MIPFFQRLLKRRSYYRHVFMQTGEAGQAVLADLRRFCRAGEPPIALSSDNKTDIYATGMAAGRQEVFWRIAHHLHLDDSELLKLKESIDHD